MTKEEQIAELNEKIQNLENIKSAYLLQKGKSLKGISIRTKTESVTFNSLIESEIYTSLISTFIDSLILKINEEIEIINNYINTLV